MCNEESIKTSQGTNKLQNDAMETDTFLGENIDGNDTYQCPLKLRLDPSVLETRGIIERIFQIAFINNRLSNRAECFNSCYDRYMDLVKHAATADEKLESKTERHGKR